MHVGAASPCLCQLQLMCLLLHNVEFCTLQAVSCWTAESILSTFCHGDDPHMTGKDGLCSVSSKCHFKWLAQAVREAEERQRAALEAGPGLQQPQPQPQPKKAQPAPAAKRKPAIPIVRVKPAAKAGSQHRASQEEGDRGGGTGTGADKRQRLAVGQAGNGHADSQEGEGLGGLLGEYGSDSEGSSKS